MNTSMSGYRFPTTPKSSQYSSSRHTKSSDGLTSASCQGSLPGKNCTYTESVSTSYNELSKFGLSENGNNLKRSASFEDARQNLLKISPITSNVDLSLPCEQTIQTIHIEARNSPTPSEMARPPLCRRMWSIVTDFFTAICICLQVNRDCLFCLGFFVAFVVSASFLTAFFYRTLSTGPETMTYREIHTNPDIIHTRENKMYYL